MFLKKIIKNKIKIIFIFKELQKTFNLFNVTQLFLTQIQNFISSFNCIFILLMILHNISFGFVEIIETFIYGGCHLWKGPVQKL